jgi:hypothetical protein
LRTLRTNFDRNEQRRDRRYPLPAMIVTLEGRPQEEVVNWSLGGFLLPAGLPLEPGAAVSGTLRLPPGDEVFAFTAELVRRETAPDALAFRFLEQDARLLDALDRALVRRVAGRGR